MTRGEMEEKIIKKKKKQSREWWPTWIKNKITRHLYVLVKRRERKEGEKEKMH
jgi:hypothetical protein